MSERSDNDRSRYAPLGVVSNLSSGLTDSIQLVTDLNLKGVIPLNDLPRFDLSSNNDKVTAYFPQENSSVEMTIDLPLSYSMTYPSRIFALDDGHRETILLPAEILEP